MKFLLPLLFIAILFIAILNGCASMGTPAASLIDDIPVVTIGDSENAPEDHIVFIPKNTSFPVEFSLSGNLLNTDASQSVNTSIKHDLYLYKYWSSLDGRQWVHSHKLMSVKPSGGFDKSGGKVEVNLDLNKEPAL